MISWCLKSRFKYSAFCPADKQESDKRWTYKYNVPLSKLVLKYTYMSVLQIPLALSLSLSLSLSLFVFMFCCVFILRIYILLLIS